MKPNGDHAGGFMEWATLALGIDDEKRTATIYGSPEVSYHLTAITEYVVPHDCTLHSLDLNVPARVPVK
jgi:hypothetical protein